MTGKSDYKDELERFETLLRLSGVREQCCKCSVLFECSLVSRNWDPTEMLRLKEIAEKMDWGKKIEESNSTLGEGVK